MDAIVSDADLDAMRAAVRGPAPDDIILAETRLRAAQCSADIEALDALIADAILFTGPDGRLATKQQDLDAHASGLVRFRTHVPEELRVMPVGRDVAMTALCAWLVVEVGGTSVSGRYRYTRVWARELEGSWRVVGGHVSAVATS